MRFEVSAEGALNFVRRSVYLTSCWPLSVTATEFQKKRVTVLWSLTVLSMCCSASSELFSIYVHRENLFVVTTSLCFGAANISTLMKSVIFRIHMKKIQSLTWETENFLKKAQPQERRILQRYVKRCSAFYFTTTITAFLSALVLICGPLFLPIYKFPTFAAYPFSIECGLIRYFVYLFQSIACVLVASNSCLDNQAAFLLWFAGARMEMLAQDLETICNRSELITIIVKHRDLIRFAQEIANVMSYIAMTIIASASVIVVTSSLILFSGQSYALKIQFGPFIMVGITWVFVCAWPADNLIDTCKRVEIAAYNSAWLDMSPEERKVMLIVLQRSQQPVVVSIGGFVPILSLAYYRSYVSVAISYIMTLRIIVGLEHS